MLPAWKRHENPGPSSALSLKDESTPLILFLAETTMTSWEVCKGGKTWKVRDTTYVIFGLHLLDSASCKGIRQTSVVMENLLLPLQKCAVVAQPDS